jgi:hypothetical protein
MSTPGNTAPTSLEKLQAAVASDITIETQAVTLILEIPALIAAAQGSENPNAALDALTASLTTAGTTLQTAIGGSGSAELLFSTPVLPQATVGASYTGSVLATGGESPVTVTVTGLPAGLSADASGNITGTVTAAAGDYTLLATATDAGTPPQTATFTPSPVLTVIAAAE